jgi:arginine N-succinyltransferase
VCHLLQRAGFRYLNTIDPFDGGPHYGAPLAAVQPIQHSHRLVCLDLPPMPTDRPVLLANPQTRHFLTTPAQRCGYGIRLAEDTKALLDRQPGDCVWMMPLDW